MSEGKSVVPGATARPGSTRREEIANRGNVRTDLPFAIASPFGLISILETPGHRAGLNLRADAG